MTKKEQSYLRSVKERAALNLPGYSEPKKFAPPKTVMSQAWFVNAFSKRVTTGWTNGEYHNRDCATLPAQGEYLKGFPSRGGGTCYETKLEALKALRWEMTLIAARELANVDEMIEQEMGA